jgi:hypothetical protein
MSISHTAILLSLIHWRVHHNAEDRMEMAAQMQCELVITGARPEYLGWPLYRTWPDNHPVRSAPATLSLYVGDNRADLLSKEPYHVDMYELSTFHKPITYRCDGHQG